MPRFILPFLLLISLASPLQAAPDAELWPRWQSHDAANDSRIDHRAWGALLRAYLVPGDDGVQRFHYAGVSEADRKRLDEYVDQLASTEISAYNRDVQLAYWINLYNALTVREILRYYPVTSIREISSGLFSFGPWDKDLVEVEGEELTLNDIEHRILRPIWNDPRIHYAVNCASIGCPDLQMKAFTAGNTEAMLDRAARDYVNHPRGAQVVDGELMVSSIYVWFIEDFGGNDAGVIEHLRQYAQPPLAAALQNVDHIDNDDYDWNLNSVVDVKAERSQKRSGAGGSGAAGS